MEGEGATSGLATGSFGGGLTKSWGPEAENKAAPTMASHLSYASHAFQA